jgi:hypothetical protein
LSSRAVHQVLLRQRDQFALLDEVRTLHGASGRERPNSQHRNANTKKPRKSSKE